MRKTFNTRHKKKYCKQDIESLLRKMFNTTRYKNEYCKQDIEFLLRKVKTLSKSKSGESDFKNFGAGGIAHLALAISENYKIGAKKKGIHRSLQQ